MTTMISQALLFVKTEFWGDRRRFQNAAKVAVACCLAIATGQYLKLENLQWTIITIMIVALPNVGSSIQKSLYRAIGTVIGGFLGAWMVSMFGQEMWLYLPLEFAVLTAANYFWMGRWHSYAFFLAGVTTIITGLGQLEHQESTGIVALMRITEVLLGIFSYQAVNMLLWPVNARKELFRSFESTLRKTGAMLRGLPAVSSGEKGRNPARLTYSLSQAYSRNVNLIEQSGYESAWFSDRAARFMEASLLAERISRFVLALNAELKSVPGVAAPEPIGKELGSLCDGIAGALDRIAESIWGRTASSLSAGTLAAEAARVRENVIAWVGTPDGKNGAILNVLAGDLFKIAELTGRLEKAVSDAWKPDSPRNASEKVSDWFTTPWSPPDSPRLRYAALTALCTVVFIFPLTYWHFGFASTAAATVMIIAQPTIGGMRRKALLRNIGCIAGGITALFCVYFLVPHMTLLWHEMIMIFAVFFICGYIKFGSERISYAGVQMGMAFTIAAVAGSAPSVGVLPVFNRLLGIFFGVVIGGYVLSWLWPRWAHEEVVGHLAGGHARFGRLYRYLLAVGGDLDMVEWISGGIIRANARHYGKAYSLLADAVAEVKGGTRLDEDLPVLLHDEEELIYRIIRHAKAVSLDPLPHLQGGLRETMERLTGEIEDRLIRLENRLIKPPAAGFEDIQPLLANLGFGTELLSGEEGARMRAAVRELAEKTERLMELIESVEASMDRIRDAGAVPR
jgi:uncharacterized membrane protein YccC